MNIIKADKIKHRQNTILEISKSYKFIYLLRFYSRCLCTKSHSAQNNNSLDNAVIYCLPLQKAAIKCKLSVTISRPFSNQCLSETFILLLSPFPNFSRENVKFCSAKCRGGSAKIKISVLKIFTLLKQRQSLLHELSSSIPLLSTFKKCTVTIFPVVG